MRHVAHQGFVAGHVGIALETLVDYEMIIALEGMAVDAGIAVAMVSEHFLKLHRSLREVFQRESYIFYQATGAHGAHTSHRREYTGTDSPVFAVHGGIFREFRRYVKLECRQAAFDCGYLFEQLLMADRLGFGEDRGEIVIIPRLHSGNAAGVHIFLILEIYRVRHGVQREIVQHLRALYAEVFGAHLQVFRPCFQLFERNHGLAAFLHGIEVHHCGCLVFVVVQGAHVHLGYETQRAFGAYHAMGDDVEGVFIGNQGADIEPRHVLDAVFFADPFRERLVCQHLIPERFDFAEHFRVAQPERFPAFRIARIQHGAVHKDDAGTEQHLVAVGMHAAVHAG